MADADRTSVLLEVTPEVVAEVCAMIADADHAALASLEPESGWPLASRVGLATTGGGMPLIVASRLTPHFGALAADPRCSLLIGTVGRGDPLANKRVTLACRAAMLPAGSEQVAAARVRYLARHPKAELYVDLPDFSFFRLAIERVRFNGGFGRAYEMAGDLLMAEGGP